MHEPSNINKKIIQEKELQEIRNKNPDKKIVLCTGCFDVLHSGHAFFINQCKSLGDLLVVSVGVDSVIKKYKGPNRPINPENNRLFLIAALQDVDYAVLGYDEVEEGVINLNRTLSLLKPDILATNDDDSFLEPKRKVCEEYGIEMKVMERVVSEELTPTSSTKMIEDSN